MVSIHSVKHHSSGGNESALYRFYSFLFVVLCICFCPEWPTLCSSLEGIEASSESSSDELTNVSLSPPERQNI